MWKAYYIICVQAYIYEDTKTEYKTGDIQWKPKECRPIQNPAWRRATDTEVDEWITKTGKYDMRQTINP